MVNKHSFTLIEVLVVIAIIGILAGVVILSLSSNTDSAKNAKAKAELSQIKKAIIVYKVKNGSYPISSIECNLKQDGDDPCGSDILSKFNFPQIGEDIYYQTDELGQDFIVYSQKYSLSDENVYFKMESESGSILEVLNPSYNNNFSIQVEDLIVISGSEENIMSANIVPEGNYNYNWSCNSIILDNNTFSNPTFTAPSVLEETSYVCGLEVSDGEEVGEVTFNIEVIPILNCDEGWIPVSGNGDYGLSGFCLMKYEAKNVEGVPISQAVEVPWVSISYADAKTECESINAHLITNDEWMVVARNIEQQNENWSGEEVGSGILKRGNVGILDDGSYNGADPEYGTERNTKAELLLSNEETIWDLSGNVFEWVDLTLGSLEVPDYIQNWREINSIDYPGTCPYSFVGPLDSTLTSANGIGQIYTDNTEYEAPHIFLRGGGSSTGHYAGIFQLALNYYSGIFDYIGFRCAK